MKANHNGKHWVVTFLDVHYNIQQTQASTLHKALCLAFINRTTTGPA